MVTSEVSEAVGVVYGADAADAEAAGVMKVLIACACSDRLDEGKGITLSDDAVV